MFKYGTLAFGPNSTGTPTSLGIPTINDAQDILNGDGVNEIVESIDNKIAGRMFSPSSPNNGQVVKWSGGLGGVEGVAGAGELYDVLLYGAKGDGVADDTVAINTAIAAAVADQAGGTVFLPAGTYKTTSVLVLPAGVTLLGSGPESVLKPVVTVADVHTGYKSGITVGRGGNASVCSLKIDGNSLLGVGLEISGYDDGQIQNFLARDVWITGCVVAGVVIAGGYRHTFDHCKINNNQVGVLVPATVFLSSLGQFDFHSCWIHDNTAEGVYLQAASVINFFGGNVENNGTYGFHFDPTLSGLLISSIGIYGVSIEANHTMGLLAHNFTQGIVCIGSAFTSSGIQPQAWQLDLGGGGDHTFLGNFQQGHANPSVDNTNTSTILAARYFSEAPPTTGSSWTHKRVALTWGVTVTTDASVGDEFDIVVNNSTAFTISNPINLRDGQQLTYMIRNVTAGALGAVTWGSLFKLSTWTQPGAFATRMITFRYDGVNNALVEMSRTTADVPY